MQTRREFLEEVKSPQFQNELKEAQKALAQNDVERVADILISHAARKAAQRARAKYNFFKGALQRLFCDKMRILEFK